MAQMPAAAQAGSPVQLSYVTMAHPDDEFPEWSLVTGSTGNYKVFIYMTRGEDTGACQTTSQSASNKAGPYWYQGPSSPVSQPNYGEINPEGTTNIWQGRLTDVCVAARIHGTLAFIESKARADASIPSGLDYRGTYIFGGNTVEGLPPRRADNGVYRESRSARVYNGSNGMGSVIFFDLGDNDLRRQEVKWAIESVQANKSLLGIPILADANAIAPYYNNYSYPNCKQYTHGDHGEVHGALWNYPNLMGGQPQYGRTCATDPDVNRTTNVPNPEYANTIAMSGNTRVGPLQTKYGWLVPNYWNPTEWTCSICVVGQGQSFWRKP